MMRPSARSRTISSLAGVRGWLAVLLPPRQVGVVDGGSTGSTLFVTNIGWNHERILRYVLVRFPTQRPLPVENRQMTRLQENGPSLEVMKRGRDKDRLELEELTAKVAALEAANGKAHPVLVEVARALLLGELASDPLQANQVNGDRIMRTNPTHADPGASTRAAREHVRSLHRNLMTAVERFDRAAEHHWYPPRPPKEPQVRCILDGCDAYGKRIPKYVGPRGVMIELSHCSKCGNRLVTA